VRQIAAAVHLSSARVHQLLHAPASATSKPTATLLESGLIAPLDKSVVPLATIAALLRECTDWLERLDRGELVTVNLRDTNDLATEYVPVDRAQVRQLMRRLARDLEDLAVGNGTPTEGPTFARREHLADLVPTPPRLSPYEERLQLSPPTRARPLKLSRKLDALA